MSRSKKVLKNSIILGLQHITINLFGVIVMGYTARKLGIENYGVYSLAFAFPALFAVIGSFGLRPLTIREVSKNLDTAQDYLGKILPARIFLLLIMGIIIPISALWLGYERQVINVIMIATISSLLLNFARIFQDTFQAFEEMEKVAICNITVRIFTGITSIIVLFLGMGLYAVSIVYPVGALLGFIMILFQYKKRFTFPKFDLDIKFILQNLKVGIFFALTGFAATIYLKIDLILISKLIGTTEVGIYNASAHLFYSLSFVADAIATATFPAISNIYLTSKQNASTVLNNSLKILIILSLPMAIGGFFCSGSIIYTIYGNGYSSSTEIFRYLSISIPFMFCCALFNYSLGAINKQRTVLIVLIIAAGLNIILNVAFITYFGVAGAAMATMITQIISFLLFLFVTVKNFFIKIEMKFIVPWFISFCIMSCLLLIMKDLNIFFVIISTGLIYFISLISIGGQKLNPIRMLKK